MQPAATISDENITKLLFCIYLLDLKSIRCTMAIAKKMQPALAEPNKFVRNLFLCSCLATCRDTKRTGRNLIKADSPFQHRHCGMPKGAIYHNINIVPFGNKKCPFLTFVIVLKKLLKKIFKYCSLKAWNAKRIHCVGKS